MGANHTAVPACDCPGPGWCERHLLRKNTAMYWVCQNKADIRDMWDRVALEARVDARLNGKPLPKQGVLNSDRAEREEEPDAGGNGTTGGSRRSRLTGRVEPCEYLGRVVDRMSCNCPLRHVRVCEKHQRCTIGRNDGDVASCQTCADYVAESEYVEA